MFSSLGCFRRVRAIVIFGVVGDISSIDAIRKKNSLSYLPFIEYLGIFLANLEYLLFTNEVNLNSM